MPSFFKPIAGVLIMGEVVSRGYRVRRKDLFYSRRGHGNEARNVAIYLARRLRGDRLKKIGEAFGLVGIARLALLWKG